MNFDLKDSEEVLYASYLIKKPTVQKTISSKKDLATNWTNWTIKKTKYNHKYWCVLRKTQFSYYKDELERVAERVIPIQDILACRSYDGTNLDIFTTGMTLRFKSTDQKVIEKWVGFFMHLLPHLNNYGSESDFELGESDDEHEIKDQSMENAADFQNNPESLNEIKSINSVNNGVKEEDKKFFEFYDPSRSAHLIQSGVIYAKNKRSITGKKWKTYRCELTNKGIKLFSVKSETCRYSIHLEDIVDCIEFDSKEPYFAVVTLKKRLKFKAANDDELVDWIINLKSCVMVRNSLLSHPTKK